MADFIRLVLSHQNFFQNDLLFSGKLRFVEFRAKEHVRKQIATSFQVFRCRFGVKTSRIFSGICVNLPADILDKLRNLLCGAVFRPLENHMFDHVRNAVLFGIFHAAAHAYHDSQADGI